MPDQPSINNLLNDFQPADKAAWTALAKKELGDRTSIESLTWIAPDGLHVKPYYDKTDLNPELTGGFQLSPDQEEFKGPGSWDNLPPVRIEDESVANKNALQHLTAGADGILFEITEKNPININKLLTGIELEFCNISFATPKEFFINDYFAYLEEQGVNKENIRGAFFWNEEPAILKSQPFQHLHTYGFTIEASTAIEEIYKALSLGNAQIQNLLKEKWEIDKAISSISFSLEISTDFFVSTSKLRTLRFLWFQLAQAYGFSDFKPEHLYLHSRSESWIHPDFQPHGNMLKETTAAIAAVLGGTNGLSLHPEDKDHAVMTRIARNTSHILREESYLNKVADPLAGSYLVENLTLEMAEKAWAKFQTNF